MNTIIIKTKMLLYSLLITGSIMGQQKLTKVSQSIKVNKDIIINLNTSHCNIVIDTWNKDVVDIEAFIEAEQLSKEELENALKSWDLDVDASKDNISINTDGGAFKTWAYKINGHDSDHEIASAVLKELKYDLADLPEIIIQSTDFEIPELPELPEMPELPELPEEANQLKFDYEAYKNEGESYLKKYAAEFELLYGKDYADKMKAWGDTFSKQWDDSYGKKMEAWGKQFEKKWNNSEKHAEKIEALQERLEKKMEAHHAKINAKAKNKRKHAHSLENNKQDVKKTIKIKLPKKAKLKVNVRHGEVEFASNVNDLKADLSHTKFTAYSINGSSTSINASYSPVFVTHWNLGELNLNYVKHAKIENAKELVLNTISSNVDILNIMENAIINSDIGDLRILNIDEGFNNLNIILQNSNAQIALPKTNCNVYFKGSYSKLNKKATSQKTIQHCPNGINNTKNIIINTKYSNVTIR